MVGQNEFRAGGSMKRLMDFALALVVTGALTASPAHAYLDGGTISLALQALTGAVAGFLLFGRTYLAKVRNLFSRTNGDDSAKS